MRSSALLILLLLSCGAAFAQQSANYELSESSVNAGGTPSQGSILASTSFRLTFGSVGETIVSPAPVASVSYRVDVSFVAQVVKSIFQVDYDDDGIPAMTDCDDANSSVYPGAPPACDGLNNDCSDPSWPTPPVDETDGDGDTFRGCSGDCDDTDPSRYPESPEINDGLDNQCPGDPGYGAVDEVSGVTTIGADGDKTRVSWPAQQGATLYEVVRSSTPHFESDCVSFSTSASWIIDTEEPGAGTSYYYLVRAVAPHAGSWGVDSEGTERTGICSGPEVDQRNLISTGNIGLSRSQTVGQTLVVGVTGTLQGIEFAPLLDSGSPSDALVVQVRDGGGLLLGSSSILATGFPPGSGSIPAALLLEATGPGYFDLSGLGIHVTAAQTISFTLLPQFEPGACNTSTHRCTSGRVGRSCFADFECEKAFRAGTSSGTAYPAGTAVVNGTPSSTTDLAFKTVVRPE